MIASSPSPLLTRRLKDLARTVGFVVSGVARVEPLSVEAEQLTTWLRAGRHGSMKWMEKTYDVRIDPTDPRMLDGAMSVLVLAAPYGRNADRVGPAPGRVARYARGRDYHNVLTKRARKVAHELWREGHTARVSVDSMPVFERAWAERAGLGFIGKNCCLIVPGIGSHVFLSCIVTTAELEPDEPMKRRCGSCRACLDACPTQAFVEARQLDARRCISYLTIENRGSTPEEHRAAIGDWIFGCDVCQDVCPFNRTSPVDDAITAAFAPHPRWEECDAAELVAMDDSRFDEYAQGSPMKRAGREGMARNAAIVLGNCGERRHLPVLRTVAGRDPSAIVREAAAWAAERIEKRSSQSGAK